MRCPVWYIGLFLVHVLVRNWHTTVTNWVYSSNGSTRLASQFLFVNAHTKPKIDLKNERHYNDLVGDIFLRNGCVICSRSIEGFAFLLHELLFEFMKYFCEYSIFVVLLSLRVSERNGNAGPLTIFFSYHPGQYCFKFGKYLKSLSWRKCFHQLDTVVSYASMLMLVKCNFDFMNRQNVVKILLFDNKGKR